MGGLVRPGGGPTAASSGSRGCWPRSKVPVSPPTSPSGPLERVRASVSNERGSRSSRAASSAGSPSLCPYGGLLTMRALGPGTTRSRTSPAATRPASLTPASRALRVAAAALDAPGAVRQPVLQLLGTASREAFAAAAAALDARLANGTIARIEGAAHGAHHTHPDAFVAAVEAFL